MGDIITGFTYQYIIKYSLFPDVTQVEVNCIMIVTDVYRTIN